MKPLITDKGLHSDVWQFILWLCAIFVVTNFIFGGEAKAGPYVEVGVGNNTNLSGCSECWNDGGGTGALLGMGYIHHVSPEVSLVVHWTHFSQWEIGAPFNNKDESSIDHLGLKVVYEW
jgi:hypothetical protein